MKLWYYAEGAEAHGPLSLAELAPLLSRIDDLRQVKIWRHGFDDWKAVEEVREVAQRVVRPPLSASASPPLPPSDTAGTVVDAADAAEFKDVKPELKGVSGWLGLHGCRDRWRPSRRFPSIDDEPCKQMHGNRIV